MSGRLGDILLERGLISEADLRAALEQHERTGERLGRVLLTLGMVRRLDLARTLAEHWNRPFVTISPEMVDLLTARRFPLNSALDLRAIPLSDNGHTVVVATSKEPSARLSETLEVVYPDRELDIRVTTEWDVDRAIAAAHRRQLAEASTFGLRLRSQPGEPVMALSGSQYLALVIATVGLVAGLATFWLTTLLILAVPTTLIVIAIICFRAMAAAIGPGAGARMSVDSDTAARLTDRELPIYTILIPMFDGAERVTDVIAMIESIDYPADKLDILMLFEENDHKTLTAAKLAAPSATVRFLMVPDGIPRSRARACNVGLLHAHGEFVVAYDIDQTPDPDQLRKVVAAFSVGALRLACLQAREVRPQVRGLLDKYRRCEQLAWFGNLLPGLDRIDTPAPLGRTSNHFRTATLRGLGGWDPFMVGADADLGIRARLHKFRLGTISSETSDVEVRSEGWLKQRADWIRGYLQAALLFSRDPAALVRRAGVQPTIGLLLLVAGMPVAALLTPAVVGLVTVWLATGAHPTAAAVPDWFLWMLLAGVVWGPPLTIFLAVQRRFVGRAKIGVFLTVFNPGVLVMNSIAAYRAAWVLLSKPAYRIDTHDTVVGGYHTDGALPPRPAKPFRSGAAGR